MHAGCQASPEAQTPGPKLSSLCFHKAFEKFCATTVWETLSLEKSGIVRSGFRDKVA